MIILGLAGQAGVGKDTVANYLRDAYGFFVFAFSDMIYKQVQDAFSLPDQDLLRNRGAKESPSDKLTLQQCSDADFVAVAMQALVAKAHSEGVELSGEIDTLPLSPREVMQWWGTEYRRAQDGDYWVKQSHEFVRAMQAAAPYPEMRPQYFVNTTTRFKNERDWVHACGGNVWHIHRDGIAAVNAHVSETPLEVVEGERELWNNDTIERLHAGVDTLLRTGYRFVRVEPLLPMVEPPQHTDHALEDTDIGCPACQHEIANDERLTPAQAEYDAALTPACPVAERIQ